MAKKGIFYGSTTGNTEAAAKKIQTYLEGADIMSINAAAIEDMKNYDLILLGASTWGIGDLQDDWEPLLDQLSKLDLNGKKVAIFGTGDQSAYSDTFVDAIGILYDALQGSNAELIGTWPTEGYDYSDSKAVKEGKFVGLPLDDDTQSNLTEQRIQDWVADIKKIFEGKSCFSSQNKDESRAARQRSLHEKYSHLSGDFLSWWLHHCRGEN